MTEFKVGDRVKILSASNFQSDEEVGQIRTINANLGNGWYETKEGKQFHWRKIDMELFKPNTPRKSIRKQLRAAIEELRQIAGEAGSINRSLGLRIDAATDKVCDAKDQL